MPKVNPEILSWARETAGLSLDDASRKLGFADTRKRTRVDRLLAYESGQEIPSRSVLNRMAKRYRRPLITLYLSKPPRKDDIGVDFRVLPAEYIAADGAILDALIRDVLASQSLVRAALEDEDEAEPLPFINSRRISDGQQTVLETLQNLLKVRREDFYKQPNTSVAFSLLRDAAENAGVFVILKGNLRSFQTNISTEIFRGFTIADDVAPFVIINENDARSAWSFTLLHELVHLILGQTGVGNTAFTNPNERFCDDVAGEFLLPVDEIAGLDLNGTSNIDNITERISEFAGARNLSRAMVAYKGYRAGAFGQVVYQELANNFRLQWREYRDATRKQQRQTGGGPNYYVVRRHRIGNKLVSLVARMVDMGALSTTKAAKVLDIKPTQVERLTGGGR